MAPAAANPAKTSAFDVFTEYPEHQSGRHQRQRDGDCCDDQGAPVQPEDQQSEQQQSAADKQRYADVPLSRVDIVGWPEQ